MANDLDDLDDIMGGSSTNNKNAGNMDLEDDDDFFGGGGFGGQRRGEDKKKSAKGDSNDPLAFLQRAQAEKQNAAQKKAMKQQQAQAEWRTTEQLSYNLNSDFMDFKDKWKQNLGADLYKDRANSLAVDSNMRQMIIQKTVESNISL